MKLRGITIVSALKMRLLVHILLSRDFIPICERVRSRLDPLTKLLVVLIMKIILSDCLAPTMPSNVIAWIDSDGCT
jgi:hypothetical protein